MIILVLIFIPANSLIAQNQRYTKGVHKYDLHFNNQNRSYLVYIPKNFTEKTPASVVINFHGGGGNANNEMTFSMMNETADKYGFIVVYPNGTPSILIDKIKTWNSGGRCCGKAYRDNSDDVGYTRELINDLAKNYNIDPARIYATGMSNGGMMSHKLGCELSDKIAAIAPVAGTLNIPSCNPKRPVPVMHFHGLKDTQCLYDGGQSKSGFAGVPFKSVPYTIDTWKKIDGCPQKGKVYYNKGMASCISYGPCKNNSEVILCNIKDGGHTWPGGKKALMGLLGNVSNDINANEEMWKFFKNHPMPKNQTEN